MKCIVISLNVIPFQQPVGSFLLSVMEKEDLIRISRADPRKFDSITLESVGGIQREPSRKRIKGRRLTGFQGSQKL